VARVLRQPGFRSLWLAGSISDLGDWLLLVALPIVVFQATGSALGTAVAFLIELAPGVVLAPLAGRLADRGDRRSVLLVVSLLQAAALVPLVGGGLGLVYAVIAVQATLAALFDPAKNAIVPSLVRDADLVAANSLIGLSQNLGRLVGGPLGGLLLAAAGLHAVVAVDVATFLIAAVLIARVPAVSLAPAAPAHAPAVSLAPAAPAHAPAVSLAPAAPAHAPAVSLAPTLSPEPPAPYPRLWRRPALRAVMLVGGIAQVAQGMFVVTFVIFVTQRLHGGAGEIGLLRGIQAAGAIAAGLGLAVLARHSSPGRLTAWAAGAFGIVELALWNLPHLTTAEPLYVVLFALVGAPGLVLITGMISYTQSVCHERELGRAFAALTFTGNAGEALGMVLAGLLSGIVGLSAVLDAQAVLYLAAGALAAALMTGGSRARRYDPAVAMTRHGSEGAWQAT
jgi:MFS family permease